MRRTSARVILLLAHCTPSQSKKYFCTNHIISYSDHDIHGEDAYYECSDNFDKWINARRIVMMYGVLYDSFPPSNMRAQTFTLNERCNPHNREYFGRPVTYYAGTTFRRFDKQVWLDKNYKTNGASFGKMKGSAWP